MPVLFPHHSQPCNSQEDRLVIDMQGADAKMANIRSLETFQTELKWEISDSHYSGRPMKLSPSYRGLIMKEPRTGRPNHLASRRTFLQSGTAMLGAAATGVLPLSRAAHAAGTDTLKIGLVGCGGRGTGAAANALNADRNTQLVAVADVFSDRLDGSVQLLQKRFPDRIAIGRDHRFVGFDACRDLIDTEVDVVLLATPPHFRPAHLKACVEAGKHVFCEKPVAVDATGVRAVMAASEDARQKGLNIVSGLMYRYHTGMLETIQRVRDGAIGRIVAIQETYNCGPPWFRNRDRKPEWTEMEYQMRNWYPFTWLSGDHNVEQHVHSLDKAAWALEDRTPERAWGSGGRQVRVEPAIGQIYDHHCVVYEYADGVRLFSHCRRQAGCANEISDIFLGTKGTCNLSKQEIDGENPWRYQGPKCNAHELEHVALFQAIRSGRPINNGLYMAHSTLLAVMGRMVTYTGKAVRWKEAMASKEDLSPARYAWDAEPPVLPDDDGRYPLAMPGITPFI